MAGAQERHAELLADAAMLGEEYRLGSLRWARTAREKIRAKEIVTLCLLALTLCGIPIAFAEGGLIAGLATIAGGACLIAVAEVIDKRLPPPRAERAFWYSGGLVQVVEGEPEPRVVRWEQLVSVSIKTRKDYEDGRVLVAACTVSDQAGVSATLDRHYGPQVPADLAEKASGILAPRLMPRYRAAFDAVGVGIGTVWIDHAGITYSGGPYAAAPLVVHWENMRRIDIEGGGAALLIHHKGVRSTTRMILDGPNGPLALQIVQYAAVRASVDAFYWGVPSLPAAVGPADDPA